MNQATNHGKGDPVVFFRADRNPWVVITELDHYMDLLKNWKRD